MNKSIESNEVYKKLADALNKYISLRDPSPFDKGDNEVDLNILKQSIIEKDRRLLYVVRPWGTCLLRCDKYFFPKYYLSSRGDYRSFKYVEFNLCTGEHEEISWQQGHEILSRPMDIPHRGYLGRHEYLVKVVNELRMKGYGEFLKCYNLDELRRFAIEDDRSSLVKYIDNINGHLNSF
ncbi:hypothetical protein K9692_003703 [Escherichia coli]|uniref:hypothetical protein n=1 Tax=Buttiauxella gaviniae TaxID=82990 RepID=UPI001D958CB0|nr:hypothetical protein [Escherichia coli]